MQTLTVAEAAILKSKLQAGTDGHRQQVKFTALNAPVSLHNPYYPSAALLPSGQAGLLLRGLDSPYTPGTEKVYFIAYSTEHAVQNTITLFNFSTNVFDIATYYPIGTSLGAGNSGIVVAVAWEAATSKLWMRTSYDSGASWNAAVQVPAAVTFAANTISWNGTTANAALHLKTNFNQNELYLFFINNATKHVRYRKTTDPDPTTGWSADTDSGFTIPSLKRNYGGAFNGNQGDTRAYVIVQTESGTNWIIGAESDDGDFHANHAFFKGTLGGAWTRKLNDSHGGGLSGNQGANGGVFIDYGFTPTAIIGYAMSNDGLQVTWWRSLDDGETWTADNDVFSTAASIGNMGAGAGLYVDGWSAKRYIWGGEAGLAKTPEALNRLLVDKIDVLPTSNIIRAIIVNGTRGSTTVDVSDRVYAISIDKDDSLDADTFSLEMHNEDQALDLNNAGAVLYKYAKPNVIVDIWQWHGDVANKLQTFHGSVDQIQQHDSPRTISYHGRGAGSKKLLVQDVRLIGTQDLSTTKPIRNMSNFVYLNKTINEVLAHIHGYAQITDAFAYVASTFLFKELRGDDLTSLMDLSKRAASLAGVELWEDEIGVFRTRFYGQARPSVWTFRADEDITSLDPDTDDDALKTRVRVLGKANIGAKYLSEIAKWAGPQAEGFAHGIAGVAYDPTTKHLWALCQDGKLYLLDPSNVEDGGQMPVIAGPYATGLTYPDDISVDPVDNNLWLSEGFDATVGNNGNRKFKKVNRADGTTVILGPYTNPQGDHCSIWAYDSGASVIKLKMTTFTGKRIYTMVATTGLEDSHVDLNTTTDPTEPNPTGIAGDTGGGLYVTGWESTDFFQLDMAGNLVNAIKQPDKNSNSITTIEDATNPLFGSVFEAFRDQPAQIVLYEPITPQGVETATYAEVINESLEQELGGEVRMAVITDLAISDKSFATRVGNRQLDKLSVNARHVSMGATGHPGIQKGDRITVISPSTGIAATADWVVTSIRSDQKADTGDFLMVLVLVPYTELVGTL